MSSHPAIFASDETQSALVSGFGISYGVTSLFSSLLMVLKESSPAVHGALGKLTGHHWTSHAVLDVLLFVVLGLVLTRMASTRISSSALINIVAVSTIVGGLIIAGYSL